MPDPAQYFERASAIGLLRRRHPYDFRETYDILRIAYGYRSHFVNLGLWKPDDDDLDAGERLMRFLCARSGVTAAELALDIGSGLGAGALEIARSCGARRVVGVNINERQLAFANALSREQPNGQHLQHLHADACRTLPVEHASVDVAFAVECIGHFSEPDAFLHRLHAALKPNGVFVCCMNIAKAELPFAFRTMVRATYGFVPRPLSSWLEMLQRAGFVLRETGDLTEGVLVEGTRIVRGRLDRLPMLSRLVVARQLALTQRAVARGRLGYAFIVAAARPPNAAS